MASERNTILVALGMGLVAGVLAALGIVFFSGSTAIATDEGTTTPDLLPDVDLVTEEVGPEVYRVLSDGVRDFTNVARNVTVTPEGDAWVWVRGAPRSRTASCPWDRCTYDWSLVRLGEPGVSFKVRRQKPWGLGLTADGVSITGRPKGSRVARVFDGKAWQKTELTPYDKCVMGANMVGADGSCADLAPTRTQTECDRGRNWR